MVIGYSLDVFHLFSAASAELIGHGNKFHINPDFAIGQSAADARRSG